MDVTWGWRSPWTGRQTQNLRVDKQGRSVIGTRVYTRRAESANALATAESSRA